MRDTLESQLDELLAEDPRSVELREQSTFDDFAGPLRRSLVFFGAGGLGRKALRGARNAGTEPLAFCDNNPRLWNTVIEGVPVLSPQDASRQFGHRAVFIVTIWTALGGAGYAPFHRQLESLGCERVISWCPFFWKFAAELLPEYAVGAPTRIRAAAGDVRRVFHLLADADSRREFLVQLRWRLLLDFGGTDAGSGEDYFPRDLFQLRSDEVFVDCGAYDGDTVQSFLGATGFSFGRIVAMEPDPATFAALKARLALLPEPVHDRIEALQLAVGARRQRIRFARTGLAASAATGADGQDANCAPLDEVLRNCAPTLIKMDIEGAELDALTGARSVVATHRPILAACLYHRDDHLWRIPLLIESLCPGYKLFVRPTREGFWHLVCYAVSPERLIPVRKGGA